MCSRLLPQANWPRTAWCLRESVFLLPLVTAVNMASLAVASVLIALSNLMLARVAINPPQSCQLDTSLLLCVHKIVFLNINNSQCSLLSLMAITSHNCAVSWLALSFHTALLPARNIFKKLNTCPMYLNQSC